MLTVAAFAELQNARHRRRGDRVAVPFAAVHESACGRYCCKSLFALLIKNSLGSTCNFGINM